MVLRTCTSSMSGVFLPTQRVESPPSAAVHVCDSRGNIKKGLQAAERSGLSRYSTNLVWGNTGETYDFPVTAGYRHRSELQTLDRDFALCCFTENPQGGFSSFGNPGVNQLLNAARTAPIGHLSRPGLRDPRRCGNRHGGSSGLPVARLGVPGLVDAIAEPCASPAATSTGLPTCVPLSRIQ